MTYFARRTALLWLIAVSIAMSGSRNAALAQTSLGSLGIQEPSSFADAGPAELAHAVEPSGQSAWQPEVGAIGATSVVDGFAQPIPDTFELQGVQQARCNTCAPVIGYYPPAGRGNHPGGPGNVNYPCDWGWGCGGSPFRTGPGTCDTWRVGPVWDVWVDGIMLTRNGADLEGIAEMAGFDSQGDPLPPPEITDQFDRGRGGRVYMTGDLPPSCYAVQVGYVGVEEWDAAVVFPKLTPMPVPVGDPPPHPDSSERRSVHYHSSMHSGEINIIRPFSDWKPYVGIRFVRIDDDLYDLINQVAPEPLPGDPPDPLVRTTDRMMVWDLENNLLGCQIGLRRDVWNWGKRLSMECMINGGAYFNEVRRTSIMATKTTQIIANDTGTVANEASTSVSNNYATITSELSDMSFLGEATVSLVYRLNRCVAIRGGYQFMYINGLYMADDAYLVDNMITRSVNMHGSFCGLEYRR